MALALVTIALVSQALLWSATLSRSVGYYTAGGYLVEDQQAWSVSAFGYESQRSHITETARMCGIDPARPPMHLVVDDLTYSTFVRVWRPFNLFYLIDRGSKWVGSTEDRRELIAFLKSWRAGGLVAGCHMVPPDLRDTSAVLRNGDFCCMRSFADPNATSGEMKAGSPPSSPDILADHK